MRNRHRANAIAALLAAAACSDEPTLPAALPVSPPAAAREADASGIVEAVSNAPWCPTVTWPGP